MTTAARIRRKLPLLLVVILHFAASCHSFRPFAAAVAPTCPRWSNSDMDPEWLTVVRRTQRDLSRDLPLQRIPLPAVHVPSVMCALLKGQSSPSPQRPINDSALVRTCLPTGTSRSVSQAFRTAITSMLDQGYRRLEVDVYHSTLDGSWQLCPWNTSSTIGSGGGSSTLVVTAQDDCTIWPTLLSPVFDWIDGRNNLYNWDTVMLVLYPQTIESDAGTPVTEALPFADILSDSRRSGMVYTPAMHGQLVQSGILPDAETWLSKFQMYRRSRMLILGYADDVDSVEQRVPTYNATLDAGTVFEVDAINGDRSATEYCDDRDIFAMDIVEDCADVLSAMACDKAPLVDGNAILDSVMQVSIWAWSENEPPAAPLYPVPGSTCAVMLPENGRWLPEPCSGSYRVACMSTSNNKNWLISSGSYVQARGECPSGYQFSIPRTSRQNSILAALARAAGVKVWLNYSDRGFAGCWAVGGERCPYSDGATAYLQIVQVSLVAGVLLLMLAFAFTIFQYRQYRYTSQKRRRKQEVLAAEAQSETMTVPA